MSPLQYAEYQAAPIRAVIEDQIRTLAKDQTIICECGQIRHFTLAYRCLYCGIYFCFPCAEQHFGKTREQWVKEQRTKLRKS